MSRRKQSGAKITMDDIARKLGLSSSTVSRAFSRQDSVNSKTLARIMKVAEQLNYRPNPNARALASQKTHMIGFILHSLGAAMFPMLLRQTQELLLKKGYDMHLALAFGEPQKEKEIIDMMLLRGYDGIIFNTPPVYYHGLYEVIDRLIDNSIPLVVLGRYDLRPVSQVRGDFRIAGKAVTEHLLNLGHKRIAYIGREGTRLDGYMEAHRNAGADIDPALVFTSKDVISECTKQAEKAVELDITAIFAHYDEIAVKILRTLRKLGKKVPSDIALAGVGDEQYSDLLDPPLTTYRMHEEYMGNYLVDMIMEKIKNPAAPSHTILLPGELIPRESTLGTGK